MKIKQIEIINQMRTDGAKPTEIARRLDMSVNTIKSHIRRHPDIPNVNRCLCCGKSVIQPEGRKKKKFCSNRCRSSYWNQQRKAG